MTVVMMLINVVFAAFVLTAILALHGRAIANDRVRRPRERSVRVPGASPLSDAHRARRVTPLSGGAAL